MQHGPVDCRREDREVFGPDLLKPAEMNTTTYDLAAHWYAVGGRNVVLLQGCHPVARCSDLWLQDACRGRDCMQMCGVS